MDQLAIKGKKCKLEVCSVCENSNSNSNSNGSAGSDDFVDCEKCGQSIHKICFKLSGDLLKIFQDFEKRNEKFPFTILCPECRQFSHEPVDKVQVFESNEGNGILKNPFEIDCIVKVIVDHLNIQDLVNVRLVNKLWNQNAYRIISKESRQVQLEAYDVKNLDFEKCLEIVKSSDQVKLMQKWIFYLDINEDQNTNDLKVFNQIITITKPKWVIIFLYGELKLEDNTLFSTFLANISENVVDLLLDFEAITYFKQTQFCMPKFSKLKSLTIKFISSQSYEFVKMIIENSPNLMNLNLYEFGDDNLTLDDYINEESTHCILTEKTAQNLQILKISSTDFDFETFEMKLKTLSLYTEYPRDLKFGKMKTFLTSQNDTLENLKITIPHDEFVPLDEIEDFEGGQLDLPRMNNVQHFSLNFQFEIDDDDYNVYKPDQEIWPVKPINFTEKLPNLQKISMKYCQSWACSFETGQNCVTELILKYWTDGDLIKLVELFPQVKFLNLKKFCFNTKIKYDDNDREKIYTQLENLNGWSESLKRIEISCEYYHLENLDFEKLVCLSNLESIKISKTTENENDSDSDVNPAHFIYPDFTPLFKIATLTQVAITNFKISKGIVEDLREKYPSLDYSFYPSPKC